MWVVGGDTAADASRAVDRAINGGCTACVQQRRPSDCDEGGAFYWYMELTWTWFQLLDACIVSAGPGSAMTTPGRWWGRLLAAHCVNVLCWDAP